MLREVRSYPQVLRSSITVPLQEILRAHKFRGIWTPLIPKWIWTPFSPKGIWTPPFRKRTWTPLFRKGLWTPLFRKGIWTPPIRKGIWTPPIRKGIWTPYSVTWTPGQQRVPHGGAIGVS